MAKKKKTPSEGPKLKAGGDLRLKLGQEVLYMTPYILDKTTVASTDKEKKIAKLSNGIQVSLDYPESGYLFNLSPGNHNNIIRVWSEEVDLVYQYEKAHRNMKGLMDRLISLSAVSPKDVTINIYNKLNKLIAKYE